MVKSVHTPEQKILQRLLRDLRKRAGLRQIDLAGKLDCPRTTISAVERGEKMLDLLEARQYCQALGINLAELVDMLDDLIPKQHPITRKLT